MPQLRCQQWQIDTTEGGDMAADLSNLFQGVGDSKLATELREEYGADLVQMHGNYDSSCGLGCERSFVFLFASSVLYCPSLKPLLLLIQHVATRFCADS